MDDASERLARMLRERAEEAELERLVGLAELLGPDEHPDGTVLRFRKTFDRKRRPGLDARWYTIVALKAGDLWYLTGPQVGREPHAWHELVTLIVSGTPAEDVQVASWPTS